MIIGALKSLFSDDLFFNSVKKDTIIKVYEHTSKAGPEVIFFSCSTQLSMNFFLLINVKTPTIAGKMAC